MAEAFIGISGWTFPPWRGTFYPDKLAQKKELEYASRQLSAIEVNGTFYSLQRPTTFQTWYDQTPASFRFAVKGPQYITHIRRLKEVAEPLANFLASGLFCLKEKLGPILWQFPPNMMLKDDRFEHFLKLLPKTPKAASALAKKHGDKVEGRSVTKADPESQLRHAFEFRHASFQHPDFLAMLREHNVAFVTAHAGEKSIYVDEATADFRYLRLHGFGADYVKGYPRKEILALAKKVKGLTAGKKASDVFLFFSNEAKIHSPTDAISLLHTLGIVKAKPPM